MTRDELELELRKVNRMCSIKSGMGEVYEYWHDKQKQLLVQLAPHRRLTVYEVLCLGFSYELCLDLIRTQSEPTLEYQGQTIRMKRETNRIAHEGNPIPRTVDEINDLLEEARSPEPTAAELFEHNLTCEGCQNVVPAVEIIDGKCAICREKQRESPDYSESWDTVVVCDICGTRYDSADFCMTCYLRAQERAAGCQ